MCKGMRGRRLTLSIHPPHHDKEGHGHCQRGGCDPATLDGRDGEVDDVMMFTIARPPSPSPHSLPTPGGPEGGHRLGPRPPGQLASTTGSRHPAPGPDLDKKAGEPLSASIAGRETWGHVGRGSRGWQWQTGLLDIETLGQLVTWTWGHFHSFLQ